MEVELLKFSVSRKYSKITASVTSYLIAILSVFLFSKTAKADFNIDLSNNEEFISQCVKIYIEDLEYKSDKINLKFVKIQLKNVGECGCRSLNTNITIFKRNNSSNKEYPWSVLASVPTKNDVTPVAIPKSELENGDFRLSLSCG